LPRVAIDLEPVVVDALRLHFRDGAEHRGAGATLAEVPAVKD
jgi:hypothetical protein